MTPPASDGSRRVRRRYLRLLLPICVLGTLLLVLASYHMVRGWSLEVGNAGDGVFLSGVHADEADTGYRYRWTEGHAEIVFIGAGAAEPVEVGVTAQGFRPSDVSAPVTMTVRLNGMPLTPSVVTMTRTLDTYRFSVPPGVRTAPPYTVSIDTATFRPSGDARDLGVKLSSVQLTQTGAGLNLPPFDVLLWYLVFAAGLVYLLAQLPGIWGRAPAASVWLGFVLLSAVFFRMYTAAYLPWPAALLGGAALLHWGSRVAFRQSYVERLRGIASARLIMLGAMLAYAALALWVLPQVDWIGHADYAENAVVARNLVNGHGLTVDYVAQFYRPHPTLTHPAETWPQLQPLLIAPFFALFGSVTWVAKLPNLLVLLALAWLVFSLAGMLWGRHVGLLSGLLTLLHPYFFNSVLYPINDLAFTAIFFWLAWLVWVWIGLEPQSLTTRSALGIGTLAGLLVWSKPSGVLLLVGLALWTGWRWLRDPRAGGVKLHARALLPALGAFALVLAPLLLRNVLAFGSPFFSTEGYDAWILRYWPAHEWEDIYKVWTGGELPNFRWVLGGKFGYENLFKAAGINLEWVWRRGVLGEQGSSDFVFGLPALIGATLGLAALPRKVRGLFGMVGLSVGLYALFVLGYWHYEGRYFQVAVPWLYMLLAWGLCWLWDRLRGMNVVGGQEAAPRGGTLLLLPLAVAALLWPMLGAIGEQIKADTVPTGFVTAMEWLKGHTTPQDVVMTRDPWELNWYSERRAVMIPYDDEATVERIARQYGVTYLQLGGPVDGISTAQCPSEPASKGPFPTGVRPVFGKMYCGVEKPGYRLVYRQGGLTIYKLEAGK